LPDNLHELAVEMRRTYSETAGVWWVASGAPTALSAFADNVARPVDLGDMGLDADDDIDAEDGSDQDDLSDMDGDD